MQETDNLTVVKLVTEEGLKSVTLGEALKKANEEGMDLVLLNDRDNICKIMNYSKYLYEQKKQKKVQKKLVTKEIKFGPGIAEHDLNIKIKNAKKMLSNKNRVKFIMTFRGRITQQMDYYKPTMEKLIEMVSDVGKVYMPLKREGNNWVVIIDAK